MWQIQKSKNGRLEIENLETEEAKKYLIYNLDTELFIAKNPDGNGVIRPNFNPTTRSYETR